MIRYFIQSGDRQNCNFAILLLLCFAGALIGGILFPFISPQEGWTLDVTSESLLYRVISYAFPFIIFLFIQQSFFSKVIVPLIFIYKGMQISVVFETVLFTENRSQLYNILYQELPVLFTFLFIGSILGAYSMDTHSHYNNNKALQVF